MRIMNINYRFVIFKELFSISIGAKYFTIKCVKRQEV
ncbi:hypothetical protein TorRG33x02_236890 [Trema orientale]|uniref:Uncharacterized protein n=1 Tax=Trema orientale TaxID=63057 RepID=A0A2P5E034_TREOI|nr:hypothetical protein TorRG33x02_236890 [Trema orientale]